MQRRDFLLTGCKACGLLLALPAIGSLEGCASTKTLSLEPAAGSSTIDVPLSAFAEKNVVPVHTSKLADELLVVKLPSGEYRALLKKCTHKGGPLSLEGDGLKCGWHDSRFDLEGKPVSGPAKAALKSYPVAVEGDVLKIDLAQG